jgi:hypothetical protein
VVSEISLAPLGSCAQFCIVGPPSCILSSCQHALSGTHARDTSMRGSLGLCICLHSCQACHRAIALRTLADQLARHALGPPDATQFHDQTPAGFAPPQQSGASHGASLYVHACHHRVRLGYRTFRSCMLQLVTVRCATACLAGRICSSGGAWRAERPLSRLPRQFFLLGREGFRE